jgi:hypothetical protein
MGPPWLTGAGVVLVVAAILSLIFFPFGLIIVGVLAVILGFLAFTGGAAAADDGGTPPDPVTGGPRWWQKRWDE